MRWRWLTIQFRGVTSCFFTFGPLLIGSPNATNMFARVVQSWSCLACNQPSIFLVAILWIKYSFDLLVSSWRNFDAKVAIACAHGVRCPLTHIVMRTGCNYSILYIQSCHTTSFGEAGVSSFNTRVWAEESRPMATSHVHWGCISNRGSREIPGSKSQGPDWLISFDMSYWSYWCLFLSDLSSIIDIYIYKWSEHTYTIDLFTI